MLPWGNRMTDQPGWATPEGDTPRQRPPLSSDWAAEQPPVAPPSYGQPQAPYGAAGKPAGQRPPQPSQPGWGAATQPPWGGAPAWAPPKPGVIPLRPLGVGEILDGAISTIRANPRIMLGLSAIVAAATQLVTVPITWLLLRDVGDSSFSFNQSAPNGQNDFALTASALSAAGVQILVTLIATLLLTGILTVALSRAVLGQSVDGGQAWAQARPRLMPLLGVTMLVLLIEAGIVLVTLAPGVLLFVAGAPTAPSALALTAGIVALLCLGAYCYVTFALAPAVTVLEKQGVLASLRRSRRLTKDAWWRTFGILLLVNVIAQILAGILSVPFNVLALGVAWAMGGSDALNPYEIVPLLVTAIGTILASAVTWPFTAVSTALLYVDRRIRREALDLELARAAGYTPQGQSATPGIMLNGEPLDPAAYGGSPPPPYDG
jgi:hypothetical protein